MANLRPITPQARFEQSSEIIDPQQQRRAKSVGRYDPVADMEILDRWSQQRNQYMRDQQPQQQPQQQPPQSPLQNDRRELSWSEIERLYEMLDKSEIKKEIQCDKLGDKVKLRYIETRLEETANDLQKVIDQLEDFGKNRSKSNPEIAWKLRNSNGRFSYLTGQKPSTSGTGHAPELESNNSNPLTKGINEMKKMSMEEVLQRQRAEKLSEELDNQRNRRHGYFPGASPALQNNVQRFDHFLHQQEIPTNNFDYPSSRCSTPARRGYSQGPIQTCTVLYKFTAQNPRELSLNRGDVVRVNREIDSNWIEGERNGNVGIFPASYVQMDEDPSTSRNRVRVLYPFQARNRNELSLKRGELLRRRREIDAHWFEGTNSKGQIGIFPKCYVQDYIEGVENGDDAAAGSVIPDRPKTPKIVASTNYASRFVFLLICFMTM
uniref:SH3 domain-containing protein n=1 Tax=Panagrolaimus superbus TaxID=310955 RepID=A0A914XSY5_9BILA